MDELLQFLESSFPEKLQDRPRFAAWNHEPVDCVELLGFSDEHNISAEFFETAAVGIEIPLQGQNSNFHGRSNEDTEITPRSMFILSNQRGVQRTFASLRLTS